MAGQKCQLKYSLERIRPVGTLARLHRARKLRKKFDLWKAGGGAAPMPDWGKQQVVIGFLKRFDLRVFIETGTYKGRMVYAMMPHAKQLYSIELEPTHFENACRRFAGYSNVHLLHGQSGEVLPKVLADIAEPCLFWLDAHYSGGSTAKGDLDTPIMQELETILSHARSAEHVLLIDDARCFDGTNDYPTIEALEKFMRGHWPDCLFEVKDDIIRIYNDRDSQHGEVQAGQ